MFDWLKRITGTRTAASGSVMLLGRILSADEAPRELAGEGFRCCAHIVPGVEVAGIDKKQNGRVYEIYRCGQRSTAVRFLKGIPAGTIPESHYVVVETPSGNVGRDSLGIYDE